MRTYKYMGYKRKPGPGRPKKIQALVALFDDRRPGYVSIWSDDSLDDDDTGEYGASLLTYDCAYEPGDLGPWVPIKAVRGYHTVFSLTCDDDDEPIT